MPGWQDAIKPAREGAAIEVEVVPGSRESRFPAGYNPWRGRLEAKVKAPPEDGKANAELCELAAEALGVPHAAVRVTSGQTSRRKTLSVALAPQVAIERLQGRMAAWERL